ncbi:hypothetical protein ABIA39_005087 [Nocardia sp. GAS34]
MQAVGVETSARAPDAVAERVARQIPVAALPGPALPYPVDDRPTREERMWLSYAMFRYEAAESPVAPANWRPAP